MTTSTTQRSVLVFGMVVFAGQVPADRKIELKDETGAINPRVIFVDSLAGMPGLIISQVQEAFTTGRQDSAQAPAYTSGNRPIRLTLQAPAKVKVTGWWRTSIVPPDPMSDSLVLLDGRLTSGDHTIPVPGHVFQPPSHSPGSPSLPLTAFATVQIDGAPSSAPATGSTRCASQPEGGWI